MKKEREIIEVYKFEDIFKKSEYGGFVLKYNEDVLYNIHGIIDMETGEIIREENEQQDK